MERALYGADERYAIHELMRRVLTRSQDAVTFAAHRLLERHYRGIADARRPEWLSALVESMFHKFRN